MKDIELKNKLQNAYFYPVDFNFKKRSMLFARACDEDFQKTLWITARDFPRDNLEFISFKKVLDNLVLSKTDSELNFLFHLPFCGSSLLTKYLEKSAIVLRDPVSLYALFIENKGEKLPASISRLRKATIKLLGRSFAGRKVIVRTAGSSPQMIKTLAAYPNVQNSVFLYSTLEFYLKQVLKSPDRSRKIRDQMLVHKKYFYPKLTERPEVVPDAFVVVLSWMFTVDNFLSAASHGNGKFYTLNGETFFLNRLPIVRKLLKAFHVKAQDISKTDLQNIESAHAKTGKRYDEAKRKLETQNVQHGLSQAIIEALNFYNKLDPKGSRASKLEKLHI